MTAPMPDPTAPRSPLELLAELEKNPHLRVLDLLPALRASIEALESKSAIDMDSHAPDGYDGTDGKIND